jgi:uncharacterized Zn finger protein
MPITITPTDKQEITRIVCPDCKEKVKFVGLLKESKIDGLAVKCKRCGRLWKVKSE